MSLYIRKSAVMSLWSWSSTLRGSLSVVAVQMLKLLFKNLKLAYRAINEGGNMPCVLNAANELVVQAFLDEKIAFLDMPEIIEEVMNTVELIKKPNLSQLLDCDAESRKLTEDIIQTKLNAK